MDDMSLVYNINLCRICQIPDSVNLINTSTLTDGNTYLDLLKFIFSDIVWIEDQLISLACELCLEKIKEVANFKKLCIESNNRRSTLKIDPIKLEIAWIESSIKLEADDVSIGQDIELATNAIRNLPRKRKKSCSENESKVKKTENAAKIKECVNKEVEVKIEIIDVGDNPEETRNDIENEASCKNIDSIENIEDIDSIETGTKVSQYLLKYIPLPHERSCRVCKKKFLNIEKLKEHLEKHHSRLRRYHCEICQEGFREKDGMERHVYKHNGVRNYVCAVCGSKYITHRDLWHHLLCHEEDAKFVCDLCPDKKYKTQSSLRSHIKLVHKVPKGFLCTECGTSFSQTNALKLHMLRRHGTNRNFACTLCDKRFFTNTDLKTHAARHGNVKPHKCDLCSADYRDKRYLSKHKAEAHGVGQNKCKDRQKYECNYCSKIIASKDKLRRHIRTHTGVKPFKCRLCEQKFNCKSYIKAHLKRKHDIDVDASDFDTRTYYDVCEESMQDEEDAGRPVNMPLNNHTSIVEGRLL